MRSSVASGPGGGGPPAHCVPRPPAPPPALPRPHARHAGDAEPVLRARDGLALRVEDLRLGHHVHHDSGHGGQPTAVGE